MSISITRTIRRVSRAVALPALVGLIVAGCGGGGGGDSSSGGNGGGGGTPAPTWTAGVYQPSSTFEAQCAQPRSGSNYPDEQGSTLLENHWLRSWTNETYLWYDEVLDRNPASYATSAYFDLLRTTATTTSGRDKDQFHFTYPTDEWEALSQAGEEVSYGAMWVVIAAVPPREVVIAHVEEGSPADSLMARGWEIVAIDGVDMVNAGTQAAVDTLNAGLFPAAAGETHVFRVRNLQGAETDVTLQAAVVTSDPVPTVTMDVTSNTGYILFNDHIATAEEELIDAFQTLDAWNVTDLVLDLRYNGGGYLDIASEVAYMIAGSSRTAGQIFERTEFSDKHPTTNPVTGQALVPTPFHSTSQGFLSPVGQPLPTLDLGRVFVLTGSNTCSASEAIMNGLRGVGVEVIQIGATTCGKPYGFYPTDNCGTTYFTIQFKGTNDAGYGDYADGFSANNAAANNEAVLPGCTTADDFTHELGDPNEARFAAALNYQATQTCQSSFTASPMAVGSTPANTEGVLRKSPWRENRIMRRSM